jgi:hypothetical protein
MPYPETLGNWESEEYSLALSALKNTEETLTSFEIKTAAVPFLVCIIYSTRFLAIDCFEAKAVLPPNKKSK